MPKKPEKQFYLGNENLPTIEAQFDYSSHPEWVEDIAKSRKNILYFAENFFYIINLDQGKMKIKLHNYQRKVLRGLRDNRFVCLLASRQIGKTTLMTIYALWIACFFDDQRILVVANKEQTAINIFKRIRLAYEKLPNYLKPGTVEYGKTSMSLGNGSSIGISTTSSDAGRGDSCNVLILDELAFIDNHLVEQFPYEVFSIADEAP
jgi:phage terminase large subunit-like protein